MLQWLPEYRTAVVARLPLLQSFPEYHAAMVARISSCSCCQSVMLQLVPECHAAEAARVSCCGGSQSAMLQLSPGSCFSCASAWGLSKGERALAYECHTARAAKVKSVYHTVAAISALCCRDSLRIML